MAIKGLVDKSEVKELVVKSNPVDGLLNEIVDKLKANMDKYVQVDVSDMKLIRGRIRYLKSEKKLSSDLEHLSIFKVEDKDKNVRVFVKWILHLDEYKKRKYRKKSEQKAEKESKSNVTMTVTNTGETVAINDAKTDIVNINTNNN